MKKVVIIALAVSLLAAPVATEAASVLNFVKAPLPEQTNDKKEARKQKKELRQGKRNEFRHGTGKGSDYDRRMRENLRQRKKMDKASRKENRKNWGTNQNGDVFGIY